MKAVPSQSAKSKQKELASQVVGYWAKDKWKIGESPIQDGCTAYSPNKLVTFTCNSTNLNTELKYACWQKLEKRQWSTRTLWSKCKIMKDIASWLNTMTANITSLLERDLTNWETSFRSYLIQTENWQAYTMQQLDKDQKLREYTNQGGQINTLRQIYKTLQEAHDDRNEYEKDIWDARKLGGLINPSKSNYKLTFFRITQPWLRQAAKQYIKYSLSIYSVGECQQRIGALNNFSIFLQFFHPRLKPVDIDRTIVLEYITQLPETGLKDSTRHRQIGCLRAFLELCARERWAEVPDKRLIYNEDFPRMGQAQPRFIPEDVLAQLNQHLDKLPPHIMRMNIVLQECGMRISELCCLKFNCLSQDVHGDWFLQYYQYKMKKEHTIPISREIVATIQEQQKFAREERGQDFPYLFFSLGSPNKNRPIQQDHFTDALNKLAYEQEIRDNAGQLWRFQSHQFRHTVGTRMINMGVPQHIIQRYLGHESPEMTVRYAHIHDQTLKEEFAKFKNKIVDVTGKVIATEDSITQNTDLQWFKKNILAQALPNGSCALPMVAGHCPHANACLTCTHFRTTGEFLAEHKKQVEHTQKIIETAKVNGWQRQVEMNEKVKENLQQIIASLEDANETPA
ncbi:tyrosine-type recombinase/integrase [Microcoleus sp. Pol11C2]|uniref:tyrosine-type recombinase/integrase n=1 Tax=Microcoleus sp. Pol11C2 TaxID=3055389 RepID=UPI002FCF49D7